MIHAKRLVELVTTKIEEEDKRAIELMAAGMLLDMREYGHAAGYRKGLADAKTLIEQTLEEILEG